MYQSKKKLIKSGVVFAIIFNLIFFIIPLIIKNSFSLIPLLISLSIILISFLNPYLLITPLNYWIKFGNIAGRFNSIILLAIFFYIIIFPFACLRKFFKSFNRKKISSYYTNSNQITSSNMKDQY